MSIRISTEEGEQGGATMDAHSHVRPRLIRKSSYGRTQLFLSECNVMFREVKCMGGIVRRDVANVYHTLPDARGVAGSACWHCCEPIEDETRVVPLPRIYDPDECVYHVYGRTCSPACAKAYVIEHTTFDRGQHMNTLVKMLREVYGITGGVTEAPPRPAMKRFGGTFDPATLQRATCRILQPPFVSYCMIVEERVEDGTTAQKPRQLVSSVEMEVEDADGLDEPPPPALFDSFLRNRAVERRETTTSGHKRTSEGGGASSSGEGAKRTRATGPMSKFFK